MPTHRHHGSAAERVSCEPMIAIEDDPAAAVLEHLKRVRQVDGLDLAPVSRKSLRVLELRPGR